MVALVAGGAVLLGPVLSAAAGPTGRVRGEVVAWGTNRPVGGATVFLPGSGAGTTSLGDGRFAIPQPVATDHPYRRISAVVTAPGFGRWEVTGVPLWEGDTLLLHAELRSTPWTHHVLTPAERMARGRGGLRRLAGRAGQTCTGWTSQRVPPQDIWVYVTPDKKAEQFDFSFYVTHVLPNEWIASWDADALGAGAVAGKTYGYFRTLVGNARTSGSGCYDVFDDGQDQVFDPSWSNQATDQAVYATMGSVLYQSGAIFMSHYFAGAQGDPCQAATGQYAGWMSQWGTQTCATQQPQGKLWPDIVPVFYSNITWRYLKNFLLNPGAESDPLYPWTALDGTFTRTRMPGGKHYYLVTPTSSSTQATFRQELPWEGASGQTFHAEVDLLCPATNSGKCPIDLKIKVHASNGVWSTQTLSVTESNDGTWRRYTFDTSGFGTDAVTIRFSVLSAQVYGVDNGYLDSPFGGP